MGVGSQDDFGETQDFLGDTGVGGPSSELTMLWEGSGTIWGLNNVRINSAMQLFSHDLSRSPASSSSTTTDATSYLMQSLKRRGRRLIRRI